MALTVRVGRFLSQTQVLLTKIVTLCSEIRDIKRINKANSIEESNLPETNTQPYDYKDNLEASDVYDEDASGDTYSSHNTPNLQKDLSYKTNKPLCHEAHPSHKLSSLTPPAPNLSHNSSPPLESLPKDSNKSSSSDLTGDTFAPSSEP